MLSVSLVHTIIITHHNGRLAAALDVCPHALCHDAESFLSCYLVLAPSRPLSLHWSSFLCLCVNRQRLEAAGWRYSGW